MRIWACSNTVLHQNAFLAGRPPDTLFAAGVSGFVARPAFSSVSSVQARLAQTTK
jgi:hypothetical protein